MATVSTTRDDLKTDVRELASIAIEDKVSRYIVRAHLGLSEIRYRNMLEERLKRDLIVSDITGINRVTNRFADKLLCVLSKYPQNEERRLILWCVSLMIDHHPSSKLNR
jgi:hypothetical protein